MILVRNIRLPLSAAEPQAFEKALHTLRVPRSKVEHTGVAKLSVDARHGQPKLVYTVAVTLKQPGEEAAFAARCPDAALHRRADFTLHAVRSRLRTALWCADWARRDCLRPCCWHGRLPPHRAGARPCAGCPCAGGGALFRHRSAGPQRQHPVRRGRRRHFLGWQADTRIGMNCVILSPRCFAARCSGRDRVEAKAPCGHRPAARRYHLHPQGDRVSGR